MITGTVTGSIRASKAAPCLLEQTLLTVQTNDTELTAVDLAGAAPGDRVLIITGAPAARLCMDAPTDAVIAAVIAKDSM